MSDDLVLQIFMAIIDKVLHPNPHEEKLFVHLVVQLLIILSDKSNDIWRPHIFRVGLVDVCWKSIPRTWEKHPTTTRTLKWNGLSLLTRVMSKTHLEPIIWLSFGGSMRVHVPFLSIAFISSYIAFFHLVESAPQLASFDNRFVSSIGIFSSNSTKCASIWSGVHRYYLKINTLMVEKLIMKLRVKNMTRERTW